MMIDGSVAFSTLAMLVALALVFDFLNGFHDAANSIATVVSTGVLKPYQAVVWAAFFNFLAIAIFELKVAAFIVISPLLGVLLGALIMIMVSWGFFHSSPHRVDRLFRRTQLVSSALYSIGHGSNDAQKTMGVIWMLLIAAGVTHQEHLPLWVIASCYMAMALGTLFGGWRIVKTMGQKITKLRPVGGFSAETGGALTLFLASSLGVPVSTTHTITGAVIGVGAAQRASAVRWLL